MKNGGLSHRQAKACLLFCKSFQQSVDIKLNDRKEFLDIMTKEIFVRKIVSVGIVYERKLRRKKMNQIRRIFSTMLALLMVFATVSNNIFFIEALDDNHMKVSLDIEKEEVYVGDKTTIKAFVHLSKDVQIINYQWEVDKEDIAIVSANDHVASVEAKAPGKVKISVTVNYEEKVIKDETKEMKSITEDIELTVKEKEPVVESSKKIVVEKNEQNVDPITESYINEHINKKYAKAKQMILANVLYVGQTFADSSYTKEDETIDSLMNMPDDKWLNAFITQIDTEIALYNTDDQSDYFVGYADTLHNDQTTYVNDYCFANNNNAGEVLDECFYDKETGLAYIPKKYFVDGDKFIIEKVKLQLLQICCRDITDMTSSYQYTTTEDGNMVEVKKSSDGVFDEMTTVKTEKGLKNSEMIVSVNGIPLSKDDYTYNKDSGIVTVPYSTAAVSHVTINVDEESVISKIASQLSDLIGISDVYANQVPENDGYGNTIKVAGEIELPDDATEGTVYKPTLTTMYNDDGSYKSDTYYRSYGFSSNGQGGKDLYDWIYSGGEVNTWNTTSTVGAGNALVPVNNTEDIFHAINLNELTQYGYINTSQTNGWAALRCVHYSNPLYDDSNTSKNGPWQVYMRILNLTDSYCMIGFASRKINTQTGLGIVKFKLKPKTGNLDIVKVNANPELTQNNDCYSLAGAQYHLKSDNNVVATLTTDDNGKASLTHVKEGTYTLVETKPSKGFVLNKEQTTVTIHAGQTTTLKGTGCLLEIPANDPISIQIVKADQEKGELIAQGNATLAGAQFTIKYYNRLDYENVSDLPLKPTRTWVLKTVKQSNGKYVASLAIPECFVEEKSDELFMIDDTVCLPIGTLTIQETKAPEGYLLKGATLSNENGNIEKIDNGLFMTKITQDAPDSGANVIAGNYLVVSDIIKKQQVKIYKTGMYQDNHGSGVIEGLNNTEFTIKLKSEVEEKGWDNAQIYDVVTTADNEDEESGYATTKALPYGTYVMKETKTPEGYIPSDDITFTINKDGGLKHINVNNDYIYDYVKIIKKDKVTGQKVTLNSTSFRIKNLKTNEYVTQLVGNTKYSVFSTNSKNQVIVDASFLSKDDAIGTVVTPLMLPYGKYQVEEIQTPDGFLQLAQPVQFVIDSVHLDENGTPMVEVVIENEQPTATIKVNKSIMQWDRVDKNCIDISDLSKIQFDLIAKTEVQDDRDGSVIYEKGEKVGTYFLSKDGQLTIDQLPIDRRGTTYIIKEVKTLDGLVLNEQDYEYEFKQNDLATKVYEHTFEIKNETTKIEISKKSLTNQDELEGATLIVTDKDGNVIDQWVSGQKTHHIQGLKAGEIYTLTERITPNGYVKATSIDFKVKNNGEVQKIEMIDKIVSMTKTDITGDKEVEGATIVVSDKETGKTADTWVSTKSPHFINGLEEGKTYILSETISPEGYVKSTDIELTVTKEKENQKVIMKDKIVVVSKLDAGGKEVEGAKMQIIDEEGNIIDEWISSHQPHRVSGLEEGKTYTLHEDLAPNGYNIANDFDFTVTYDKENQTVEMIDTIVEVSKTDEHGQLLKDAQLEVISTKTKQVVDKWITGKHIFDINDDMKEKLKAGHIVSDMMISEDDSSMLYKINANQDNDDYTLMLQENGITTYYHIDINGNETSHMIQGLATGGQYILRETKAPEGYASAKEQKFTVDEDKDISLIMIDEITKVIFHKQDITTKKELAGASLKVTDKETGKVVDEWISGNTPHTIEGLSVGKTYIMTEMIAPKDYQIAESVEFTVNDTGDKQHVYMYDQLKTVLPTGDHTYLLGYMLSFLASFMIIVGHLYYVKRRITD